MRGSASVEQVGLAALAVASLALFVALGPLRLYTPSLPSELEPALPWLRALLAEVEGSGSPGDCERQHEIGV